MFGLQPRLRGGKRAALPILFCLLTIPTHGDEGSQMQGRVRALEEEIRVKILLDGSRGEGQRQPLSAGCDLWTGRWVHDPSYPLWKSCPWNSRDCVKYGRDDTRFQQFRWQPEACMLPRFDAARMRERLRGKRVMFIGDSLSINQGHSFLCMLAHGLPDPTSAVEERQATARESWKDRVYFFRGFNFTVELRWSPFLVNEEEVPAHLTGVPRNVRRVLDPSLVDRAIRRPVLEDDLGLGLPLGRNVILVFNVGHWWQPGKLSHLGRYFLAPGGQSVNTSISVREAHEAGMRTVSKWLRALKEERGVASFWMSFSPSHFTGGAWNTGGKCDFNLPLQGRATPSPPASDDVPRGADERLAPVAQQVIADAGVEVLDVQALSRMRHDAHVAHSFAAAANKNISDCLHWCLPGVPDTWNVLLVAALTVHKLI